jgi:hypothetical protein
MILDFRPRGFFWILDWQSRKKIVSRQGRQGRQGLEN